MEILPGNLYLGTLEPDLEILSRNLWEPYSTTWEPDLRELIWEPWKETCEPYLGTWDPHLGTFWPERWTPGTWKPWGTVFWAPPEPDSPRDLAIFALFFRKSTIVFPTHHSSSCSYENFRKSGNWYPIRSHQNLARTYSSMVWYYWPLGWFSTWQPF